MAEIRFIGIRDMESKSGHKIRGRRVLIVEENESEAITARQWFTRLGCEVTIVPDGTQAMAIHEETPFDMILIDLELPNVSGIEATHQIRKLEEAQPHSSTLIVAATNHPDASTKKFCKALGMDDFIVKPVSPGDLTAKMNAAFQDRPSYRRV